MRTAESRKRKPVPAQKPHSISTKAIRLPTPLVHKLLDLKKRKGLEFLHQVDVAKIFSAKISSVVPIPLFESHIQAGSSSPADELMEGMLDLNEYLIEHKHATFFVRTFFGL